MNRDGLQEAMAWTVTSRKALPDCCDNCAAHNFIRPALDVLAVEGGQMVQKHTVSAEWSRRRTRYDPPDLDDAIAAAQGLTDSIDSQVEIAAQLIGLPEDEVRSAVLKAARPNTPHVSSTSTRRTTRGAVLIERRNSRTRLVGAEHR